MKVQEPYLLVSQASRKKTKKLICPTLPTQLAHGYDVNF